MAVGKLPALWWANCAVAPSEAQKVEIVRKDTQVLQASSITITKQSFSPIKSTVLYIENTSSDKTHCINGNDTQSWTHCYLNEFSNQSLSLSWTPGNRDTLTSVSNFHNHFFSIILYVPNFGISGISSISHDVYQIIGLLINLIHM